MGDDTLRAGAGAGRAGTSAEGVDEAGAAAVRAIWARHRAEIVGQVGRVEAAVANGLAGRPDRESLERGREAAHKLAGSCGTFGFPIAGQIAGRLEEALAGSGGPSPGEYAGLAGLVESLRRALGAGAPEGV